MKGYKQIGKGTFSSVYRKGTSNDVLVVSRDKVKECMSLSWFPKTTLFPNIKLVSKDDNKNSIYKMKYYPKVKSPKKELNSRSYELYKILVKIYKSIIDYRSGMTYYEYWYVVFNRLMPSKFKKEKESILEALNSLINYSDDICFEISPRNISKTKTGKLILLDCFFFLYDI